MSTNHNDDGQLNIVGQQQNQHQKTNNNALGLSNEQHAIKNRQVLLDDEKETPSLGLQKVNLNHLLQSGQYVYPHGDATLGNHTHHVHGAHSSEAKAAVGAKLNLHREIRNFSDDKLHHVPPPIERSHVEEAMKTTTTHFPQSAPFVTPHKTKESISYTTVPHNYAGQHGTSNMHIIINEDDHVPYKEGGASEIKEELITTAHELGSATEVKDEIITTAKDFGSAISDRGGDTAHAISHATAPARHAISDAASKVGDSIKQLAHKLGETTGFLEDDYCEKHCDHVSDREIPGEYVQQDSEVPITQEQVDINSLSTVPPVDNTNIISARPVDYPAESAPIYHNSTNPHQYHPYQ